MKTKIRLKFHHFLILIILSAAALVALTLFGIHSYGFRYATYNTENHGTIYFIGRVDKSENPISGKIYYADGVEAKVKSLAPITLKNGESVEHCFSVSYSNGDTYEGQLAGMLRHGKGRLSFSGGDIYEGQFSFDAIEGQGAYYFLSGDIYEGELQNGKKYGHGKYTWVGSDEGTFDVYEGSYLDDKRNGEGKYSYADGSVYEGSYVNDLKEGKGKLTFASGEVYEGDFKADRRTGKGIYKWATGESYEGDFLNNAMTGYGTYSWTSGNNRLSYEGYFEDGKIVFVDEEGEQEGSENTPEA